MSARDERVPLIVGGVISAVVLGIILVRMRPSPGDGRDGATATSDTGAATGDDSKVVVLNLWDQEEMENTVVIDGWLAHFHGMNPNIVVNRQTYPNEELRTKFVTAATAGQAAEMVWGPNDVAGVFATANLIQNVEPFIDAPGFAPGALDAVRLEGKTMGVPVTFGNHLLLFYNKALVPTPPRTTDELIEISKKISNPDEKKYGLAFYQNEPFWIAPFIGGFGGWPLSITPEGATTITLDNEPVKRALSFVKDLKFKHHIVPQECDYDCAKGLFLEGRAGLHISGDWAVKELRQKLGDNLGLAPLPVVSETGLPMVPMVSGRYVFLNASLTPEKTRAVKKLMAYLDSVDVQREVATRLGRVPVTIAGRQDPVVAQDATVMALLDAAKNGKPMPAQTEMRATWDAMRPMVQRIMAGELDPNAAARLMQTSAYEKLASIKK